MAELIIHTSELPAVTKDVKAGDRVYLSGEIYTARDAAHLRIIELLDGGSLPPFELRGACIYYAGPTPARPNEPSGSCGPTTSGRMDAFAPRLYDLGVAATIGKGGRKREVATSIVRNGAVYFVATGGAGALYARCITASKEIAFNDLGCESVKLLSVVRMPLVVGVDSSGASLF